jgi:hypothetical protein
MEHFSARHNGENGGGQADTPRQGLKGTLHVWIQSFKFKTSQRGKPYADGRLVICQKQPDGTVAWSKNHTFFQVYPTDSKLDFHEQFARAFPQAYQAQEGQQVPGCEAFLWCEPRGRMPEEGTGEEKAKAYSASLKILGWKSREELNDREKEAMGKGEMNLSGICLFVDDKEITGYRGAKVVDGKPKDAFAQTIVRAINAFVSGRDQSLQASVDHYILKAFGPAADAVFSVLGKPEVTDTTPLYVRANMDGSRINIVGVEIAKNQNVPRTVEEAKLREAQKQMPQPMAAPTLGAFTQPQSPFGQPQQPGYPQPAPQGYPAPQQPGYPGQAPQPGYGQPVPQAPQGYPAPQPGYPAPQPQPGYPPQQGYPQAAPQPGYPAQAPAPQGYPAPQPGYPPQAAPAPQQPGYPPQAAPQAPQGYPAPAPQAPQGYPAQSQGYGQPAPAPQPGYPPQGQPGPGYPPTQQ